MILYASLLIKYKTRSQLAVVSISIILLRANWLVIPSLTIWHFSLIFDILCSIFLDGWLMSILRRGKEFQNSYCQLFCDSSVWISLHFLPPIFCYKHISIVPNWCFFHSTWLFDHVAFPFYGSISAFCTLITCILT